MALQDLTPQLRTRLSHLEHAVGLFVAFSALLMLTGFAYYIYHTAQRKGWFLNKVPYNTVVLDASGLKVGDPVKLMGFDAGEIVEILPLPPDNYYHVYVKFLIRAPHYGYLWKDSKVKIAASDFLGKRYLEVTKGTVGPASVKEVNGVIQGILDDRSPAAQPVYLPVTKDSKGYFLPPEESPALTERLDALVRQVEAALPNVFALTNQLNGALTSAIATLTHATALVTNAQPAVSNLVVITENLKQPRGALGEWLFPTNIKAQVELAMTNVNVTLTNLNTTLDTVDTNVASLVAELNRTLDGLAGITSNLNVQVQANTNLVKEISDAIVHADELMQGLKNHWFLRGAFKEKKTNAPPPSAPAPGPPRRRQRGQP